MNVPVLALKVISVGTAEKRPEMFMLARCAIIPSELFCEVKNVPNLFRPGLCTRPHWGAHDAPPQRSPYPVVG